MPNQGVHLPAASRLQVTPSVGCAGGVMTPGPRTNCRPRPPGWRRASGWLALAVVLGASPLGCCTLAGYGIGYGIDSDRFVDVPPPFAGSVPPLAGRVVRIITADQRTITGRLTGMDSRRDGGAVCLMESEVHTGWIGDHETGADTVSVESIVSARVSREVHAYRAAGVVVGVAADAVLLISILGRSDSWEPTRSP
jgi:hypothetical protein